MKYAKALDGADRSDSIIVSFDSEWHSKLHESNFSVIIRKRTPAIARPKFLYFHINAPVSKICGRAEIFSIRDIDGKRAVELSKEIGIHPSSILKYVGSNKSVGAYFIGKIELPDAEVPTIALQEFLFYSPPQSFLFLSHDGKETIDQLCRFHTNQHLRRE
ncbi:MAG: hypothetical protein ACK5X0_14570 [Rhodospirillales bacterium]|jgi:hypothetical protein